MDRRTHRSKRGASAMIGVSCFKRSTGGKGVGRGFAGAQTGRRSDWNVSAVALIGRPRFKAGGIGFVPADRITTKSLFVAVLQYRTRGHRGLDEESGLID